MGHYLARRLGQSLFILVGITLVTYLLLYLLPADPVRQFTRGNAPPAVVESIRRQLGLDLPCGGNACAISAICCRAISAAPTSRRRRSRR